MKLLITGSRGWHDELAVERVLSEWRAEAERRGEALVVIHGHARSGADKIADHMARRLGIKCIRVPAKWDRYGKAAGPIRNQQMLDEHDPDVVIAFRATGKSNGTDDMIRRAQEGGYETHIVTIPAELPTP